MMILSRQLRDIFGKIPCACQIVDAAYAAAVAVNFEHHSECFVAGLAKNNLQCVNDEFHGRFVVVQQEHLCSHCRLPGLLCSPWLQIMIDTQTATDAFLVIEP